ncbi:MAG: glycosyltransferase family 4 protein [Ferruginibacter sp.]|nr:glycosyltransferase family 4 protein [Ferruginibacter sp.]
MSSRLAIVTTHPIQYYAPVFSRLAKQEGLEIKVFYTWQKEAAKFDRDFGKDIEWDIPLLDGYDHSFVSNNNNTGRSFFDVKNPGLIKAIEDWNATAVLVIGWNYLSHLKAMFHFKNRIPVLFRGDSTLLDENGSIKKIARRIFLKWIYRHIDQALYVGTANKAYFLKHGVKESQLVFAPHAIDNGRFSQLTNAQETFIKDTRKSFGIATDDTTIVYCGKLLTKKNPLLLAQAVKEINNEKLHVIFVGDGVLEQELKQAITGYANMHLLSFQNQSMMPAIYRLGEIFCLPSAGPGETWGLAVNEAMACGRAILVSDKVGCTADLVQEGINGYSFRSNDINDLEDKINRMISDKDRLASMEAASARLIEVWNFDAIATAIKKRLQRA